VESKKRVPVVLKGIHLLVPYEKGSGPDTSSMSAADMMKMLSGGGGGKSSNSVAEGTTEKVVKKMIDFLKKNELLP
jgi:electron transfer flavoprotein beta subunit